MYIYILLSADELCLVFFSTLDTIVLFLCSYFWHEFSLVESVNKPVNVDSCKKGAWWDCGNLIDMIQLNRAETLMI